MAEEVEYVACRKFFLTVVSAENLPVVRKLLETRAYAKISIGSAESQIECRTNPDNHNDLNPAWHHARAYEINESGVLYDGLSLVIKLYTERTFGHDRYIGEVHMTMKKLFDQARSATLSLPIMRGGSTKETGATLNISYRFGETYMVRKSDFEEKVKHSGAWWKPKVATKVAAQAAKMAILIGVLPLV